jgi:competence protein CoiA
MPLRALNLSGESIQAFDFSPEEWAALKASSRVHRLVMPCCGADVVLKTSRRGTQFFAHKKQGECTSAPESEQHLRLKALVVKLIRKHGWTAATEVDGKTPSGEPWVADVLATKGTRRVAVEIQWSSQTDEKSLYRQQRYHESDVRGLWLMHQANFPISKEFPAVCVDELADGTFMALLAHDQSTRDGQRRRSRREDWEETLPIEQVIQAAFTKRLWYGLLRPGAKVSAEVFGGRDQCWRCGRWTGVISYFQLMPRSDKVMPCIVSLEALAGQEDLLAELLYRHPASAQIGPIRVRYSATAKASYLSNGCLHCNVLQGRFFVRKHESKRALFSHSIVPSQTLLNMVNSHGMCRWHVAGEADE